MSWSKTGWSDRHLPNGTDPSCKLVAQGQDTDARVILGDAKTPAALGQGFSATLTETEVLDCFMVGAGIKIG